MPECSGRSFKDIDRLFRENVPLRKFHKYDLSKSGEEGLESKEDVQIVNQSLEKKEDQ